MDIRPGWIACRGWLVAVAGCQRTLPASSGSPAVCLPCTYVLLLSFRSSNPTFPWMPYSSTHQQTPVLPLHVLLSLLPTPPAVLTGPPSSCAHHHLNPLARSIHTTHRILNSSSTPPAHTISLTSTTWATSHDSSPAVFQGSSHCAEPPPSLHHLSHSATLALCTTDITLHAAGGAHKQSLTSMTGFRSLSSSSLRF